MTRARRSLFSPVAGETIVLVALTFRFAVHMVTISDVGA
jgi:hypothetical protein